MGRKESTIQHPDVHYLGPYPVEQREELDPDHALDQAGEVNYLGPYLVEQRDDADTNDVLRRTRRLLYQATGSNLVRKLTLADLRVNGTRKTSKDRSRKGSPSGQEEEEELEASPAPTYSDIGRGMFSISPEVETESTAAQRLEEAQEIDGRLGPANTVITNLAASRREIFERFMALRQRLRDQLRARTQEIQALRRGPAREEPDDEIQLHHELANSLQPHGNPWRFHEWSQHFASARAAIVGLRDVVILVVVCYAVYRWFYRHEFAWAEKMRRKMMEDL